MIISNLTILEIVQKVLAREVIVTSYNKGKKVAKKLSYQLIIERTDFTKSLRNHFTKNLNWANSLHFQSLSINQKDKDVFIDSDYYSIPSSSQRVRVNPAKEILNSFIPNSRRNLIILGKPGMGKSTLMKKLFIKILTDDNYLKDYKFPLLIRLHEVNSLQSELYENIPTNLLLYYKIYQELGLTIDLNSDNIDRLKTYLTEILQHAKLVLILDGFDEVSNLLKDSIYQQYKELILTLSNCRIFLTTRTGEFPYEVENSIKVEIAPLNISQIVEFSKLWFSKKQGKRFLEEVEYTPYYDALIRPLTLSFLTTIYELHDFIPEKPWSLYETIVDLLIDKWDKKRAIKRKSKFSKFDKNIKLSFLKRVAFELSKLNKRVFTSQELEIIYKDVCQIYDLPEDESEGVLNEIESHSGLLIQSGFKKYEFAHKSIQEYLCGDYLSRFSNLKSLEDFLYDIPNELALAITLTSNPDEKLEEVYQLTNHDKFKYLPFVQLLTKRIAIEKPNFPVKPKLAITLIKLLSSADEIVYNNNIYFEKKAYHINQLDWNVVEEIYPMKNVTKSFKELELFYDCNRFNINKAIRQYDKGFDPTEIYVKIVKRKTVKNMDFPDKLNVVVNLLKSWKKLNMVSNW